MSGFKGIVKDGWHPKGRDGGKESWRGDFKGINQVAGWMGKGKTPGGDGKSEHISRPLATLKDPSSFGPPPRNVNYHGGVALPNEITPHTGGWGAPLTQDQIASANRAVGSPTSEEAQEEPPKPAGPPLPYRADRTGLKTDHLPPPPTHRDVARGPSPAEAQPSAPRPPPRLPSRQNTASSLSQGTVSPPPSVPPPAYDAIPVKQPSPTPSNNFGINQSAINRLGNAGVSVPALGIGGSTTSTNPWQNEQSQSARPTPSPKPVAAPNQLSELQSRFARMNSNASSQESNSQSLFQRQASPPVQHAGSPPPANAAAQPPASTWAEKQAAMRTAAAFQKDPSKVSAQDAKSAATTINNFRERHKEDINAAGSKANELNKKYNLTGRMNSFLEKNYSSPPPDQQQQQQAQQGQLPPAGVQATQSPDLAASISRKPPPPPPPKKPAGMHGNATTSPASKEAPPPPVPLGTKPSYS